MRPTELVISTGAVAANARLMRSLVPASVRMMCVVKADAYGHGAVNAAYRLMDAGADAFCVAIVEEAEALRAAGIALPILILGGAAEPSLREAVRCAASQAVYDIHSLDVLRDEARRLGVRARAHLKLDTGMSRVGVRTDAELDALLDHWRECPEVDMEGVFTHFCVADTDPEYTDAQNARFEAGLARARAAGFRPVAHAAATSALLEPRWQHDMVRAGIGLYGTGLPGHAAELSYAQRLVTRPIRVETIRAGETVGYGRTFTAARDSVIMTLPIGYGDGYPRLLSNRADVLVRGRRAPLVGRVCMDMIMADVTDIPGVSLDDEVVLMGSQGEARITPDELAERAETIPYEIMLGFGPRVSRRTVDAPQAALEAAAEAGKDASAVFEDTCRRARRMCLS